MACTFKMFPDNETGSNNWLNSGSAATATAEFVDNDNDDGEYIYENQNGHRITFTFPDPVLDSGGSLADSDIDSITSVQLKFKASYTAGSGTTGLYTQLKGTDVDHALDNHSILAGGSYATYSGDLETDSDDDNGDDWEYSHLQALQVFLRKNGNVTGRTELRVSYLYVEVTYVPSGYSNIVNGITNCGTRKINGIPVNQIGKVNGV